MALRVHDKPITVGEAAAALGLPGPWTLRRLEARGRVPKARRTVVTGQRYYLVGELPRLRALIAVTGRLAA